MAGRIIKHKSVGEELDSVEWASMETHELADNEQLGGETIIVSNPPSGFYRIVNIYLKKIGASYHPIIEYDDIPIE